MYDVYLTTLNQLFDRILTYCILLEIVVSEKGDITQGVHISWVLFEFLENLVEDCLNVALIIAFKGAPPSSIHVRVRDKVHFQGKCNVLSLYAHILSVLQIGECWTNNLHHLFCILTSD